MPGPVRTDRAATLGLTPENVFGAVAQRQRHETPAAGSPRRRQQQPEPSYYDVSILKTPVWKWEIAGYFFLGGVSAGAYLLARLAERFGGEEDRSITRAGTLVAFLTSLPCAPLLIKDLGDPKRFHHMLRIWKPSTPMNLGTWTLMAYSGSVTASLLREYLRQPDVSHQERSDLARLTNATALTLHDAADIPLALLLVSYTGILLTNTANPLWCRNPWISPLFNASAASTGAEAVSLSLDVAGTGSPAQHKALERISTLGHVAEGVTLAGYLWHAGVKAHPLTRGSMKHHMGFTLGALVASEILKKLPVSPPAKRWTRIASATLGLAAGFSLRWAMTWGGHEAARDPHLARQVTRSERNAPSSASSSPFAPLHGEPGDVTP